MDSFGFSFGLDSCFGKLARLVGFLFVYRGLWEGVLEGILKVDGNYTWFYGLLKFWTFVIGFLLQGGCSIFQGWLERICIW